MIELLEILICILSLSIFTGLYVYKQCSDKFEKVAYPLRSINKLSNPEERFKQAFPDEVTRKTVEKMVMKIPSAIKKVLLYLFMGLSLLIFVIVLTSILKKYIEPFPQIWGKIGSGLATMGVMFISLGSWSIQTWSNETLPEKLRDAILVMLWTTGTFLIFMS